MTPIPFSDHCLIEYMFENTCTLEKRYTHSIDVNGSPVNCKYKWKPERRTDFINGLNSEGFIDQLYNLTVYTSSCLSEVDIYSSISKYLYNFPNVTVKHRLDLFDKLIMPILNYSCEVCGIS